MSLAIADIVAVLALLGTLATAWIGLRKLRPELAKLKAEANRLKDESQSLQAESEKLRAEADKARAERDSAEARAMESISNAAHTLVDPLTEEIKLLRTGREEDRRRIRKLEGDAAEMGKENILLKCKVEELENRNVTLSDEIASLRRIVDDYRSGRRKPTGPLENQ